MKTRMKKKFFYLSLLMLLSGIRFGVSAEDLNPPESHANHQEENLLTNVEENEFKTKDEKNIRNINEGTEEFFINHSSNLLSNRKQIENSNSVFTPENKNEKAYIPNINTYKFVSNNGFVTNLYDSYYAKQALTHKYIDLDYNYSSNFIIYSHVKSDDYYFKDDYYVLEFFRENNNELSYSGLCDFYFPYSDDMTFECSVPIVDFNDQPYLYLRFGVTSSPYSSYYSDVVTYKVKNPYYQYYKLANVTSLNSSTPSGVIGSTVTITAKSDAGSNALYEFQVWQNGAWVTKQSFSKNNKFNYKITSEGYQDIQVLTRHKQSLNDYDDFDSITIYGNPIPTSEDYVMKVSYFRPETGKIYVDGYSYVRGVQSTTKSEIIQKLKFVDKNTGRQVKTYTLDNFKSTAVSNDYNHGAGLINYDYAKFKSYLDISDLAEGTYYIKLYTNAKGYTYDEIINFHTSITDFSFMNGSKIYAFNRTTVEGIKTLQLQVIDTADTVIGPDDHIKRVSYFRPENNKLYIDGYSYVRGINIPNKSDIIQKLKFVNVITGKQVKTYELPNYYSTAASKDPNHGNNIYNYDWAKFKGYLDIRDLPVGEYYIKIYTNAKKHAFDEIIAFHSSIGDFTFQINGKKFEFIRIDVNGIGTLKLHVYNK